MPTTASRLTRIGVFYDGNYFLHVSNYYNYSHERRSRISISGLHAFIRRQVAEEEGVNERLCQIVDAHYFRGRLNAHEANQRGNQLFYDRLFDDILMSEGVVTHYLPVKTYQGYRQEKGIDVWLALEAFELAQYKKFDVVVLITSDGDYVPLIRKLNTLGSRIMVLSWDFEFLNEQGEKQVTRTSQDLLEEVSYPVAMHGLIDDRSRRNDIVIQNLFVKPQQQQARPTFTAVTSNSGSYTNGFSGGIPEEGYDDYLQSDEPNYNIADGIDPDPEGRKISTIRSLKTGYGFVNFPPNNLFFHYTSLIDTDFNELQVDDEVEFTVGQNAEGKDIAVDVRLLRS
ncbi:MULTISPECIES: NYN domain-containing protein [Spirosoma]|uniref:NYN domain-containing protein n=1 Tax=Spirosoma liriopis TaxID=2937440 RepID=A0ABT0HKA9_9BACT|nr:MULTISPECIES: NYN domain-containing protein [Spirosoma]MCK8492601.1 NYN domain-containing protein [Spirosoma liriopis]UHG92069.1 NYN domain-containing protein [Spirosoma oryzicola]